LLLCNKSFSPLLYEELRFGLRFRAILRLKPFKSPNFLRIRFKRISFTFLFCMNLLNFQLYLYLLLPLVFFSLLFLLIFFHLLDLYRLLLFIHFHLYFCLLFFIFLLYYQHFLSLCFCLILILKSLCGFKFVLWGGFGFRRKNIIVW
jgi:hypothetical protein